MDDIHDQCNIGGKSKSELGWEIIDFEFPGVKLLHTYKQENIKGVSLLSIDDNLYESFFNRYVWKKNGKNGSSRFKK